MADISNPLLTRVLHRRRMLRYARLSAAGWVIFGGLHILVWWVAFDRPTSGAAPGELHGVLAVVVWPLLLAATACFVSLVIFTGRWILSPDPQESDWQSVSSPRSPEVMEPDAIEPALLERAS